MERHGHERSSRRHFANFRCLVLCRLATRVIVFIRVDDTQLHCWLAGLGVKPHAREPYFR